VSRSSALGICQGKITKEKGNLIFSVLFTERPYSTDTGWFRGVTCDALEGLQLYHLERRRAGSSRIAYSVKLLASYPLLEEHQIY